MNRIQLVIFDLDGTIADTLPLCIKAFRLSVEPHIGRTVSDEEIVATFGPSEEGTIMALIPEFYRQGVASYLQHYEQLHGMCAKPFDGIESLLKMLKENGVHIAMVTGKGRYSTAISLKQFGLEKYFELIETGMPEGPRKPQGIQAVLNHFSGISKEAIIYVGDAPSDITASRKVGVPVIAAAWAATAESEKLVQLQPDAIFYTIASFSKWLLKQV